MGRRIKHLILRRNSICPGRLIVWIVSLFKAKFLGSEVNFMSSDALDEIQQLYTRANPIIF